MDEETKEEGLDGDKPVKIKVKGWIENEEDKFTNIPRVCPKCGERLWHTDALRICNVYWVGCKDSTCRWSAIFEC